MIEVPPLCFESEFFAVPAYEFAAILGFGYLSHKIHIVKRYEFLVVVERAREDQFVVLASIERTGNDVEVHLLG